LVELTFDKQLLRETWLGYEYIAISGVLQHSECMEEGVSNAVVVCRPPARSHSLSSTDKQRIAVRWLDQIDNQRSPALLTPVSTCTELEGTHRVRTHAVLLLALTLTLTFDLSTQNHVPFGISKPYHLQDIPRSFPIPSLNTSGLFVFELCCGQTDRQTDKQTNSKILPTPTDRVGVGGII